mgnify:CR=1 FL=1
MREALEARLREKLATSHLEVIDESHLHAGHPGAKGGGGHFRAVIVSSRFEGLNRVKAQQVVFEAVGDWMGKEIHALSMKTYTPEGWASSAEDSGGDSG